MSFVDEGYEIVSLTGNAQVLLAKTVRELEREFGDLTTYHDRRPANEEKALADHAKAAATCKDVVRRVIEEHLEFFRRLIGADMMIQSKPYLRISRPGVETDNIGFHRDTWYGDTPYECSVWMPLTDTDMGNSLQVAPGSHVWAEKAHPTERTARPDVPKGSVKHSLGFIYENPKQLVSPCEMRPIPLKLGQMVVFSLALLHGQEVNRSTRTRFSLDCRLANAMANIRLGRSRDAAYYERFVTSPVTQAALAYEKANAK